MSEPKAQEKSEKIARDKKGLYLKGNPPGPGRPKGRKNTATELRDMFLGALDELGGQAYLRKVGLKSHKAFVGAVAKMLPRTSKIEGSINLNFPDSAPGVAGLKDLDAPDE